jgi:hypothetical protein
VKLMDGSRKKPIGDPVVARSEWLSMLDNTTDTTI